MRKVFILHIVILFCSASAFAQVTDSLKVDTLQSTTPDSLQKADAKTIPKKEPKVVKKVSIWEAESPAFSKTVVNDSLLRWQFWPNWGDYYAHRKDVLSYRQGTIGRVDAFTISGYDSYEQNLYFDDVKLNNPVTGLVNYNLVPHHKIGNVNELYSNRLESRINSKNFYITKPISYLNYDESSSGYRNLEFMIAQSTSPGTNIELSYWDRREEGFYSRSGVKGSQVFGKLYHHLGSRFQLQALYLRNQFDKDESFGYVVNDPVFFPFDEFTTQAKENSAKSEFLRSDLKLGIYERQDSLKAETGGFVLTRSKNEHNLKFSSDTLFWNLTELKASLFKSVQFGPLNVKAELDGFRVASEDSTTLTKKDWAGTAAKLSTTLSLTNNLVALITGEILGRNDKQNGNALSAGLNYKSNRFEVKLLGSQENKMPSIQAMYWGGRNYAGNPLLISEQVQSVFGTIQFNIGNHFKFGASSRYKKIEDAILLTQSKTFTNGGNLELLNGTLYGSYNSSLLEIESSASSEYALSQNYVRGVDSLNIRATKLWVRNSIFLKHYVFDKATFIKVGVRTMFSPLYYKTQTYNTELSYWQYNSIEHEIPNFFRLDAELSARVRSIMVLIRWENALDGVGQAGYFESASYPLWPRRLLVGIRAQFRN